MAHSRDRRTDNDGALHVSYHFLDGAKYAIEHHRGALPGVNEWHRKPSAEHPVPVVLIHGTAGSGVTNWISLAPTLYDHGYRVFSLTYGALPGASFPESELGGLRDIGVHAVPEVAQFVERVLREMGAEQVDLVAHSQGGVIAGALAKHVLPGKVRTVVSLASPWQGVGGERLAWLLRVSGVRPAIAKEAAMINDLVHGSRFLTELYAPDDTPYVAGVKYTNIATKYDEFVVPHQSALLAPPDDAKFSVRNVVLQEGCPVDFVDHAALPSDPRAIDYVLGALDPDNAPAPRCLPTVPLFGDVLPDRLNKLL